jgi:hypothetical protein
VHVHRPGAFVELELGGRQVGLDGLLALPEGGHGKAELTAAVVGGVEPLGDALDLGVLGVQPGLEDLGPGGQGGVGGLGVGRGGADWPGGGNRQGQDDRYDKQSDGDGPGPCPSLADQSAAAGLWSCHRAPPGRYLMVSVVVA